MPGGLSLTDFRVFVFSKCKSIKTGNPREKKSSGGKRAMISLVVGCVIAYIVNILMSFYERHLMVLKRWKRAFCMSLAFLTLILVGVILWKLIFPQLAACVAIVCERFPDGLDRLYGWLEGRIHIEKILSKLGSLLLTLVLGIVFSIYILARKEQLQDDFCRVGERFLKQTARIRIGHLLVVLNRAFHSFIVGQCVEAVILGVLCVVGMWIFQFPYALMIGCLMGATALIPVAGAYIGASVGVVMILTDSPGKALLFLIFITVLQQIEGNFIYPRVVGSTIGLPGIWVFAAVVVGGSVFGIIGMFLAVPLTAAAYQLLKEAVDA